MAATPKEIVDRRVVAAGPDGSMEWHLLLDTDTLDTEWRARFLDGDGNVQDEPAWMPLPGSQFLFLQCPVFEALYAGNRGPGKTIALAMDFAKEVGKGYGKAWRGIIFRKSYKDLDDFVRKIEDVFEKVFPGFVFKKSKSEYTALWPTGEALLLRHMETEDDYETYHGHEYPWIGWEELTQWSNDVAYKLMMSCCRPPAPGIPCRVRSTTNPYGPGHNWVKKRFQLPDGFNKIIELPGQMPRIAIHADLAENFLLLHDVPHYPMQVRDSARNPAMALAWLLGDWNVTAGGMIDDLWDPGRHILPTFDAKKIPREWTITRSYDHGQSSPFANLWWLESNGESIELEDGRHVGTVRGDVILYNEWYGAKGEDNAGLVMASRKIARGVLDREDDMGIRGRVLAGPADTEIFNKSSDRLGRCPADDMEDEGVVWERADKSPGSRKRGWQMLRTRVEDALPGPDGTREHPGLFVCDRCRNWIDLVPTMPRDEKDQDEIPDGYEDHLGDATRYRLSWEVPGMWRRNF